MPIDEPVPRQGTSSAHRRMPPWPNVAKWPPEDAPGPVDFLAVLNARRSSTGGHVAEADLAAVLWRATTLRHRGSDGRFGMWESRSAPASGGLHGILLLVLPLEPAVPAGVYDLDHHALVADSGLKDARSLNQASVAELISATSGTTIQLVADARRYDACYTHWESLALRDAGALAMTICLAATARSLTSVVLGRLGSEIADAALMGDGYVGVGAVHLGTPLTRRG